MSYSPKISNPSNDLLLTKREILKESSSIFDPLGLLCPITVRGKMLIQLLWKQNFDWDEVLPEEIITEWIKIREDLVKATGIKFSRQYFPKSTHKDESLHIFADSSIKAYGACAYLVSGNESILIMAKSKVAPIKQLTVPKLELCAALLAARLCQHIKSAIDCKSIYLWSDSQIVLSWISSAKKQPIFVSNRVKEIQEMSNGFQWQYCPTHENPADLLSRGLTYEKIQNNPLWMHGPKWLADERAFPRNDYQFVEYDNPICETTVLTASRDSLQTPNIIEILDFQRYNSYMKLLRVTAYVNRFVNNCRRSEKIRDL
ncbi:uncharacterized protein LOC132725521 [Ruditapes philippinarum]|uniref:uncharacterized protein LOC132725521 n=1 Tax=Ruditapes philippinarum TaxID=129788 RepID=UPI00295B128E|nr:uncharacterized protein LOC132725521 [Ruditapes philippinarum]